MPFMLESLIVLPRTIAYIVLLGLFVAGISEFRKGHIGRVGIFLNSIILWQIFYSSFQNLPVWFQWYLNIGTVFGILALVFYLIRRRTTQRFYQVAYYAYGSFSILIVIVLFFLGVFEPTVATNVIDMVNLTNMSNGSL